MAQQNASSRTEQPVADMAFATKSNAKAPPKNSAEQSSFRVILLSPPLAVKVRSYVPDQGIQHFLPNPAGRDLLLVETTSPKQKEIPVMADPMVEMPVKS